MNAQFKQSVVIDGQKFTIHQNGAPKVYNVSPKIAKHPHFKHFVKAGLIVSTDAPAEPMAQESVEERNQRLAAKIGGQQKPSVQKVESDPVDDSEDKEPADDDESFDDMDESDFDADGDDGAEELDEGDDVPDDEPSEEAEAEEAPAKKHAKPKSKKKKKKARH